jgi:LPXTG-motif cell wall-anchored protein
MKRLLSIGVAIGALAFGSIAAYAATVTVSTASPWAYACGHTSFGNPVTKLDTPDENGCSADDVAGTATAGLAAGTLTLSKLCGDAEAAKCTADDLASGATVAGLTTLTAASFDLGPNSYCGAGAPRLNVVTTDGDTHFFGCAANKSGTHVNFDLTGAGDGSGKGGIVGKTVKSIDIVQDETGTAILTNLSFTGTAVVTATPTPAASPAAAPAAQLATTGGGASSGLLLLGALVALTGVSIVVIRRRRTA